MRWCEGAWEGEEKEKKISCGFLLLLLLLLFFFLSPFPSFLTPKLNVIYMPGVVHGSEKVSDLRNKQHNPSR